MTRSESTRRSSLIPKRLKTAQIKTVKKNIKLASFFARRNKGWGRLSSNIDLEDRHQTAKLGICLAALKFDKKRGSSFSSYAHHWIRSSLQRFSTSDHPVYIPISIAGRMVRIQMTAARIAARKGEDRALEYLHWVIERYNLWSAWSVLDYSKSEPEDLQHHEAEKISIDFELFESLSEREQIVIRFRFGINAEVRTLEYIAENIIGGISRERVRQIERDALRKLQVKNEG